jgi:hypothetical protein
MTCVWRRAGPFALLAACTGADLPKDDTGSTAAALPLPVDCSPLPEPTGKVVRVGTVEALRAAVRDATPGETIVLEAGTYDMSGGDAAATLEVTVPRVVIRGVGGDPSAVVLDARIDTDEIIAVRGEGVTVAELTLTRAFGSGLAVHGAPGAQAYRVRFLDTGTSAMVAKAERGAYADGGTVACSSFERVDSCFPGLELRQAEGWEVRDTTFAHAGCEAPGLLAWTGSRGTRVARSRFEAQGVALRLGDTDYDEGEERIYDGAECDDPRAGHFGGIVEDSFVLGGVRLEAACAPTVRHVSVWGGDLAWAFSTDVTALNNLAAVMDGGGTLRAEGNLRPGAADFLDATGGDLHLAPGSGARSAGVPVPGDDALDVDGDARDANAPSVGADEG